MDEFNTIDLELSKEDIDHLIKTFILNNLLPESINNFYEVLEETKSTEKALSSAIINQVVVGLIGKAMAQ